MRRATCRRALVFLAACAMFPAHAAAGGGLGVRPPPNAPVVAGPSASGATMVAFDHAGQLCAQLRTEEGGSSSCAEEPIRLRRPSVTGVSVEDRGLHSVHWGFVSPEVARVEVVLADGRRLRAATDPGRAYHGRYAGKVRFFIAEGRGRLSGRALYIRELAEDGTLLAAPDLFDQGQRVGPGAVLARYGAGRDSIALRAFARYMHTPLVGDEDRFARSTCLGLRGGGPIPDRAELCTDPDLPLDALTYTTDQSCRGLGTAVAGFSSPRVTRITATLGDGRRRRVGLHPLPARLGPARAFALVVGRQVAVRRLVAVDSAGRTINSRLALPPAAAGCDGVGESYAEIESVFPGQRLRAGPRVLLVRDEGPLLCLGIGTIQPDVDCHRPPLDTNETRVVSRADPDGTLIAGVVPADVTAVEVELDRGEVRRVPTGAASAYGGRYRNGVRFFLLELSGRRAAYEMRLLDPGGRRLETQPGPDLRPLETGPLVVARASGFHLGAALNPNHESGQALCFELGRGRLPQDPEECAFAGVDTVNVQASCRPHRLLLWGRLERRNARVKVVTSGGTRRARVVRVPPRLRTHASAFLIALPARAEVRRVVIRDRRVLRRPLRLPSSHSQCGYSDFIPGY